MSLLEVCDLSAGYADLDVLHDVSLSVEPGEIVAIIGSNGAGKTALLRTISGLIAPSKGDILFEGGSIAGHPPHDIVESGIAQVPEGRQVFPFLTVMQNLTVGAHSRRARAKRTENFAEVFRLFPRLDERRDQLAGTMSGGEQQMLATSRALLANPVLLMMDEPSWGLAPVLTQELFAAVQRIRDAMGTSILLIEQNVQKALAIADRAYVLQQGSIERQGTGAELLAQQDLKKAFLGA